MSVTRVLVTAVLLVFSPIAARGVTREWVARYGGSGNGCEEGLAIGVHSDGSVYVGGVTGYNEQYRDYAIVKYDGGGAAIWVTTINGPEGDFEDPPCALALDSEGFVYIAGTQAPAYRYDRQDFLTAKCDPDGRVVWQVTYDGTDPTWGVDVARDVALDGAGNVCVTGSSYGDGTSRDYATVKYGPDGHELWVARYDHGDDWANALALDGLGNVYVVGGSDGGIAVIKYDSDGNELWVTRTEGVGEGMDVAVGPDGAACVTGGAYVTAKYDEDGNEQWVATYGDDASRLGPARAIAISDSGDIWVTGRSGSDFLTVKYESEGSEAWAAQHYAPYGGRDVALDGQGCAYVTGGGHVIVKYDPDGNEIWSASFWDTERVLTEGRAVAVDALGNAHVTGTLWLDWTVQGNYATAEYSSSDGAPLWKSQYDGASNDYAFDVTTGTDGSVIVTGTSLKFCQTVKYGPNGDELWQARCTAVHDAHGGYAAVDHDGNVYVAGSGGSDPEFLLVKYDQSGAELWVAQYGFVEDGWNELRGFALDGDGNAYLTGTSGGYETGYDIATVKYDTDGNERWAARYDGPATGTDVALGLALDEDGNVYVAGEIAAADRRWDYVVLKYDAGGNEEWAATCPGPEHDPDLSVRALAVDDDSNVYFTGGSSASGEQTDFLTVKWNSEGDELWTAAYDGPAGEADHSLCLALAGDGVVVLGIATTLEGLEYTIVKYGFDGTEEWVAARPFPTSFSVGDLAAFAYDLAVDPQGNAYAVLGNDNAGTGWDYSLVCWDSNGFEKWAMAYDGPASDDDIPSGVALAPDGSIYVTGCSIGAGSYYDYATVKYATAGVDLPPGEHVAVDGVVRLGETAALVLLDLSSFADVTLRIYDLHGRLVATPYDGHEVPAGPAALSWDLKTDDGSGVVSGTYFCVLDIGNQRTRHRIAVLNE